MKLSIRDYDLKLKYKFGISRETRTVQKTMIVDLEQDGVHGYGEAVANHKYYVKSEIGTMTALLKDIEGELTGMDLREQDPEAIWARYKSHFHGNPYAQCALDMAIWDLKGKLAGKSTRSLWGLKDYEIPDTDYTIGIDDIDVMVSKMKEFKGWPLFKIKLGTDHDMEIMRALRKETDAVLRIDANCGWTPEQTIRYSEELKKMDVEFIEQPLNASDWEGMKEVFEYSKLPVVADESCISEEDVLRCAGFFHGVNIKVFKCGGLTPARRMTDTARHLGLKVMAGCMTESSVGISGIAQLLPLLDYVDMDGPLLIAEDIAEGVDIRYGRVTFPDRPGNGVNLVK